jgi:hypothetical protein
MVLIAAGVAVHVVFEVWMGSAGRMTMAQFACFEAVLFCCGLALIALSLERAQRRIAKDDFYRNFDLNEPHRTANGRQVVGWVLLGLAALAAAAAILDRLPP